MATEQLEDLEIVEETPPTTPNRTRTQKEEAWSTQPRPSCQICSGNNSERRPIHEQNAQL